MKKVAIIPSRYESTRFRGKPLALIKGKPMIQWVYERIKKTDVELSDIIVATDDERIFDAVLKFKGHAMITSAQNPSGTDRVAEAAAKLGLKKNDIVINVQGDQPVFDPRCIDDLVRPFFIEQNIQMSTLAYCIINEDEIKNPKDVKVVFDTNGFALYFSRSPIPFGRNPSFEFETYKHLGFYAYTADFLEKFQSLNEGRLENIEKLEQLRALEYGYKIKVVVTQYDSPEVDLPEDIEKIEMMLSSKKKDVT